MKREKSLITLQRRISVAWFYGRRHSFLLGDILHISVTSVFIDSAFEIIVFPHPSKENRSFSVLSKLKTIEIFFPLPH